MGKKLTADEIDKISNDDMFQGFDKCSVCGGIELDGSMLHVNAESDSDDLICDECRIKKSNTMELTRKEKQSIFWALIEKYPMYERGRKQAVQLFVGDNLIEAVKGINKDEKKAYRLISKFAKELDPKILPQYKQPYGSCPHFEGCVAERNELTVNDCETCTKVKK